ncbi:MAG TPA: family 16 glycoside hydrolase [Candidatus Solibacter sp.]
MKFHRAAVALLAVCASSAANRKLTALIVDGMNNHDWAAATRAIQTILEGSGRFTVAVSTFPAKPDFSKYDVVINNFNGGHTADGTRWPHDVELALESYVKGGGGLVVYHAANNAFLNWPEYNQMIGLGWRGKSFGEGIAIGPGGAIVRVPKGEGLDPGHGPRHDFDIYVRDAAHPITNGLPAHWSHPSEQLTHGQHGPAQGLEILTYAFSEISHQGEPMDWVKSYGRGRVYTTMLGHTWKDELNPNLDDLYFQALLARGAEWAATGNVTLPSDLGWRPLFNSKSLEGWQPRGECLWSVLPDGTLLGKRTAGASPTQAWLYTAAEYGEFDLHVEYWIPAGGNSGVSIRDRSRAAAAIGETLPYTTPAHIGYEIQIIDDDAETYPTGSVYLFAAAKNGVHRHGAWNSLDIESRDALIRVRLNGQIVAESLGDPARPKVGPIGLQLHDRFSTAMFRNLRLRRR